MLPNKEMILPTLCCCTCMSSVFWNIIPLQNLYTFSNYWRQQIDIEHSGKPRARQISIEVHELWHSQHSTVCESLAYWNVHISSLAHSHPICFPFCLHSVADGPVFIKEMPECTITTWKLEPGSCLDYRDFGLMYVSHRHRETWQQKHQSKYILFKRNCLVISINSKVIMSCGSKFRFSHIRLEHWWDDTR